MQIPSTFSGMLPGPKRDAVLARLPAILASAIRVSVAVSGGVNDAAMSAKAPAKSGPRLRTSRLANLDLNGCLVKKGCTVSYYGVRGLVAGVSRGRCRVEYLHYTGRPTGSIEWLICETVQVVA